MNSFVSQIAQVAAWDVTVRSTAESVTDINGRLFTFAWVAFTGENLHPVFSTHYYVTTDGYRYQQDLHGIDPAGYALYGNSLGFLDNGNPLYKDLRGTVSYVIPIPPGVTAQIPQYPIFFSDVSPGGANGAAVDTVLTALNITTSPVVPMVTGISFTGSAPIAPHTTQGSGGTFNFTAVNTMTYQIVISRDGVDFSPSNASNATLTGIAGTGNFNVVWNGNDDSGIAFPVSAVPYKYKVYGRAGEIHLPLVDVENNGNGSSPATATFGGGPTITLLNSANAGSTTVYFDDRGYMTSSGTLVGNLNGTLCPTDQPVGPNPDQGVDGVTSTLTYGSSPQLYRWWPAGLNYNFDCVTSTNPSYTDPQGWGDAKALDEWAFFRTQDQINNLYVDPIAYDAATTVAAPTSAVPGSTVQGAFTFSNNGNAATTGMAYSLSTGTSCTPSLSFQNLPSNVTVSCAAGIYTFAGTNPLLTTLDAGASWQGANTAAPMTFTYTAPASGLLTVTSTISTANADSYLANNTAAATTGFGLNDVQTTVSLPATAIPGSTVSGSLQFANIGAQTATAWTNTVVIGTPGSCPSNVLFTSLPIGVSLNTYNASTCQATFNGLLPNLPSGQNLSFGFSFTAPMSGNVPVNTTISAANDANPANNQATASVLIVPSVTPLVTKSASLSGYVTGQSNAVVYTITASNSGPSGANGFAIVDTPPSGLTLGDWTCTVTTPGTAYTGVTTACLTASGSGALNTTVNLQPGALITFTVKATIASNATGKLINAVSITAPQGTSVTPDANLNAQATVGPSISQIPTLQQWALLAISALLASLAIAEIRARAGRGLRR